MTTIVPAILTDNISDFSAKLKMMEGFPKLEAIHIDFADSRFVQNATLQPASLPALPLSYEFTAHLMCNRPQEYLADLHRTGFEVVSFHYEAEANLAEVQKTMGLIKDYGMRPQLAINPETSLENILPILKDLARIHIMTVDPGRQGNKYVPGEAKIKFLRWRGFYGTILVDGGIDKSKVRTLLAAGADQLVVGSAILKAKDPKKVYLELLREAGEKVD